MTLFGLSASPSSVYNERIRQRQRTLTMFELTSPPEETSDAAPLQLQPPEDEAATGAATWAPGVPADAGSYASKFKADLTSLMDMEPWREEPAAHEFVALEPETTTMARKPRSAKMSFSDISAHCCRP